MLPEIIVGLRGKLHFWIMHRGQGYEIGGPLAAPKIRKCCDQSSGWLRVLHLPLVAPDRSLANTLKNKKRLVKTPRSKGLRKNTHVRGVSHAGKRHGR